MLILVVLAPVLLFPAPNRLWIFLVIPLVWWCEWRATGRIVPPTPLNAPLWFLMAMAGVSLYATFDVRFSLGKFCGLLLGSLLFWGVTRWTVTRDRLTIAVVLFIIAGATLAVLGLVGTN